MKQHFLFLLLVLSSFYLQAQNKYDKEPFMTKSLANASLKNVDVETAGGSISVSGVSSDARIAPGNSRDNLSKEEIQKKLDEMYDLKIDVSNNKLTAVAKSKKKIKDWNEALSISFKVFVPSSVSTDLSTSGGNINLSNLSGNHDFTTSGGNLNIDKVSGKLNGRTSGGNINLENSKDEIDLSTSGGNITAKNTNGKLRLSTSGGNVSLSTIDGNVKATTSGGNVGGTGVKGELIATTSGGSINFSSLACSLEAATSGGSIDVSFSQLGQYVKVSNSGGNIDLELPKNKGLDLSLSGTKIKTDRLDNFSGKIEDEEIQGKLNGGGVPVTVRAGSGRVYLTLK